jgi:hypothetical protein
MAPLSERDSSMLRDSTTRPGPSVNPQNYSLSLPTSIHSLGKKRALLFNVHFFSMQGPPKSVSKPRQVVGSAPPQPRGLGDPTRYQFRAVVRIPSV